MATTATALLGQAETSSPAKGGARAATAGIISS
jgi:hypothetical protein